MITTMRGCVAHNDLWPWPISSRSFGLDLENSVRSVAFTVLDGFFLYLAQMITIIRGCVACYVFFRIWKFEFLAIFGLDLEKKNLQFSMDSFHIWYKWSLVWESVLHIMTFDLDLYQTWYDLCIKQMIYFHGYCCVQCTILSYMYKISMAIKNIWFDLIWYLQGHLALALKIVSAL